MKLIQDYLMKVKFLFHTRARRIVYLKSKSVEMEMETILAYSEGVLECKESTMYRAVS